MEKNNFASDHILVLRFSAMGDVALATPVVKSLAEAYPTTKISIVTRPKFGVFFHGFSNVTFVPVDLDKNYKGFGGIFKLFNELRALKPTVVIDIHDHLRTKLLRLFFRLSGTRTIVFEKGRSEKKKSVRASDKLRGQLTHTVDRYHAVFEKANLKFPLLSGPFLFVKHDADEKLREWIQSKGVKSKVWIGVAPFAAHKSKMWPLEKYKAVIENLSSAGSYHFFLFGGGKFETEQLATLQNQFPNVTSAAGELGLNRELALIEKLSLMLCGDSSNMHLAALLNVPVVSVWGGTHPHLGFGPWGQGDEAVVQIPVEDLPCRPCSVYGTSKCLRGDFACLTQIDPQKVADRVRERLK